MTESENNIHLNFGEYEEWYRKQERQKYYKIMRLARNHVSVSYNDLCHLLKYKYNIAYFGTKNLTNRYLDDLISIGKLKKDDNGIISLGDFKK